MSEFSIGEAMNKFLRGSKLKGDIQAIRIMDIWEKLMGKTIAKYTDSIKIYGSKLYISTKVAPLRQELMFQKENIILRVNEALQEKVILEVIIN
jgi:Dna[CI] antecedent, DciA